MFADNRASITTTTTLATHLLQVNLFPCLSRSDLPSWTQWSVLLSLESNCTIRAEFNLNSTMEKKFQMIKQKFCHSHPPTQGSSRIHEPGARVTLPICAADPWVAITQCLCPNQARVNALSERIILCNLIRQSSSGGHGTRTEEQYRREWTDN